MATKEPLPLRSSVTCCHFFNALHLKESLSSCCSAYSLTIAAEGKALVKTDIAVAIPAGHYGRVGALQQRMKEEKLYCMQPCLVCLCCPFTDLPHFEDFCSPVRVHLQSLALGYCVGSVCIMYV